MHDEIIIRYDYCDSVFLFNVITSYIESIQLKKNNSRKRIIHLIYQSDLCSPLIANNSKPMSC